MGNPKSQTTSKQLLKMMVWKLVEFQMTHKCKVCKLLENLVINSTSPLIEPRGSYTDSKKEIAGLDRPVDL